MNPLKSKMLASTVIPVAMVMGVGRVNGDLVGRDSARCIAMSYDYTVLAGTQGGKNHQKQDRMFGVALQSRLPGVETHEVV